MKKIVFIVAYIFLTNIFAVNAMNWDEMDILIKNKIIDNEILQKEHVTRGDAIESLCRLMGANNEMKETAEKSFYYLPYYRDNGELSNHHQYGYFLIASGYFCKGDSGYACADRNITLKELSAFCTRILGDNSESLDDSLKKAIEVGIIKESDEFYSEEEIKNITPYELCVVLKRMLNQKRYYYAEYDNVSCIDTKLCNMCIDEDRAETYTDGFDIRNKVDGFLEKWQEIGEAVTTLYTEKDLKNAWLTFIWSPETLKEAIETICLKEGDKIFVCKNEGEIGILGEFVEINEKDIIYRDVETNECKSMKNNLTGMIIIAENLIMQ